MTFFFFFSIIVVRCFWFSAPAMLKSFAHLLEQVKCICRERNKRKKRVLIIFRFIRDSHIFFKSVDVYRKNRDSRDFIIKRRSEWGSSFGQVIVPFGMFFVCSNNQWCLICAPLLLDDFIILVDPAAALRLWLIPFLANFLRWCWWISFCVWIFSSPLMVL